MAYGALQAPPVCRFVRHRLLLALAVRAAASNFGSRIIVSWVQISLATQPTLSNVV